MALPVLTVWEVRTTGNENNGGGFVQGSTGTDYSMQDAAQVVFDGATITLSNGAASATATVTGATVDGTWPGNLLQITGGVNFTTGVYQILSTAAGSVTFDRACTTGAGSAGAGRMGGAMASLGRACSFSVAGNRFWMKAGTYTVTSASSNVAAGCATLPSSSGTNGTFVNGYSVVRGDFLVRPVFKADGVITAFTLITTAGGAVVEGLDIDGNLRTTSRGVQNVTSDIRSCIVRNCTNNGINGSSALSRVTRSYITGCSTQPAVSASSVYGSDISFNTVTGVLLGAGGEIVDTLVTNNSGATSDGVLTSGAGGLMYGVTAYNNGRDNFRIVTAPSYVDSCVGYNAVGTNFNLTFGPVTGTVFQNCAGGGTGTANFSTNATSLNNLASITLTSDPFVAAATGNFAPNAVVGGGASLRGAASLGSFPSGSSTARFDVGAVQHADPTQPAVGNVRLGTVYNDGNSTGTFVVPTTAQVSNGVAYGAGGSEFVGIATGGTYGQTAYFG